MEGVGTVLRSDMGVSAALGTGVGSVFALRTAIAIALGTGMGFDAVLPLRLQGGLASSGGARELSTPDLGTTADLTGAATDLTGKEGRADLTGGETRVNLAGPGIVRGRDNPQTTGQNGGTPDTHENSQQCACLDPKRQPKHWSWSTSSQALHQKEQWNS